MGLTQHKTRARPSLTSDVAAGWLSTAALASKPNSWPATAKGSTGQAYPTSKPGGRQVHLRVQPE